MKHFFFSLLGITFLLGTSVQAFTVNQAIQTEKQVIEILKNGNQVTYTLKQTISNTSNEDLTTNFFFALPQNTNNPKAYIDSDGIPTQQYTGDQRLEKAFEKAKETQNRSFFRFGDKLFPSFIETNPVTITPDEPVFLKLEYTTTLRSDQSWQWFDQLHLDQSIPTTLSLQYPKNEYILSNLLENTNFITENTEGQTNLYFPNLSFPTNQRHVWITWNTSAQPLETNFDIFTYKLLPVEPPTFTPSQITFLIDESGSINPSLWNKSREVAQYLLNTFFDQKSVQVGLFSDSIQWLTTDEENLPIFTDNTFETRQSIFNTLSTNRAIGKTNIENVIQSIPTNTETNTALILLTDETPPEVLPSPPTLVLFLGTDDVKKQWEEKTQNSLHQVIQLFPYQAGFIELQEIEHAWNNWLQTIAQPENTSLLDLVPEQAAQTSPFNPFFIGRSEKTNTNKTGKTFIPQQWALAKNQDLALNPTTENKEAIRSISDVFGPNQPTILGTPTYNNKTRTYHQEQNTHTNLAVQPFSEAQKYLFTQFTDSTFEGFALGESSFCTPIRCISVNPNGQNEVDTFAKLFWNERDKNHWARSYVEPLITKGLYPLNKETASLELDTPITRGQFATMLYQQMATHRWRIGTPKTFTDLPEDHTDFEAITWFSQHKIFGGYEDGSVKPDQQISRAEAIKILLAADGYKPKETDAEPTFIDSTGWEKLWVNEGATREYISGYERGTQKYFEPHKPLTKGQAAKIISEFLK